MQSSGFAKWKKSHGRQPGEHLTTFREDFIISFVSMQTLTFSLHCAQEQNQTQMQNHCWRKRKQFSFQWEFDFESAQQKSEQKDETPFWGTHETTDSARNERDVSSRHGHIECSKRAGEGSSS